MKVSVSKYNAKNKNSTQSLVILVGQNKNNKPQSEFLPNDSLKAFQSETKKIDYKADFEQKMTLTTLWNGEPCQLYFVGVGQLEELTTEKIRRVTALACSDLKSLKKEQFNILLEGLETKELNSNQIIASVTESLYLTSYKYQAGKSKKDDDKTQVQLLLSKASDDKNKNSLKEAEILAESINFARFLGDSPGNLMTPTLLLSETKKAAKGTGLKVSSLNKQQIVKEKMGGLFSVAKGSDAAPQFIMLEYKGTTTTKKPICFVGKGLTFDAGGISLKPSAGMEEMKYDMCGGANVIGTMIALAKLKVKVNAVAYVPACENLPGPSANKPGDIVTSYSGKTVEVNNTDAEGRLILMDALHFACKKKPEFIVDIATLTGAMGVSLGNIYTGIFSNNSQFLQTFQSAANKSGEKVWAMPLDEEHKKDMKGHYADLTNLAPSRGAGSSTAAAFLSYFVEDSIPWVHCDIAGTGWNSGNRLAYHPKKGATGVMIRTFIELAKMYVK